MPENLLWSRAGDHGPRSTGVVGMYLPTSGAGAIPAGQAEVQPSALATPIGQETPVPPMPQ